jgi:hypothetical protein
VADVATLVWSEDFESGSAGTWFPGGSSGTITADTTSPKVGAQSCKIVGDPAWGLKSQPASFIHVISFYIRMNTIPNGIELFSPMTAGMRFGIDDTTKKFGIIFGTAQTFPFLSTVTPVVGQWYRIEIRINASANPWVVDWQIDGVPQTQRTNAAAANNSADIYVGHATGFVASVNLNYDQIQYSQTAADYPLSAVSISLTAPPATFTARSVAPAIQFDDIVVAPPPVFMASSANPSLFIGVANTVVAPPVTLTASAVAPTPSVSVTITAPPATFTSSSVAPGISRDWLITTPPATFTAKSVAPPVSGSGNVVAPVAVTTFTSVAPTPTVSLTRIAPPATFTASSVAPILTQGRVVVAPVGIFTGSSVAPTPILGMLPAAAVWTATALAPGFGMLVAPNAALVTYTSVAPAVTFSDLVVAPPAVSTYTAVSGALSLGGSIAPNAALVSFSAVVPILQASNTVVAPAAVFSSTTAPPVLSGAGAVAVPPATWTATSVAPSVVFSTTIVCIIPSLITNGTFETDTSGWTGRGGATLTRDTSLFHGGVASLRLDTTAQAKDAFFGNYPVVPGNTYLVQGWVYITTGTIMTSYCDFKDSGNNYVTTRNIQNTSVVGSWVQVSARILIPPGIFNMSTYFQVNPVGGVGVLNIDDVSCTLVPLSMAVMSPGTGVTIISTLTGLCPNGDFETNTTSWAVAGAGSTITRDTTQAAVGSASLFCATDGTIVTQGCFYNSLTITPAYPAGMKHRVSFWIKANTPGDVGKQIGIYFRAWLGGSINYTINPSLPPGTLFVLPAAWTYMTFEFAPTLAHDRAEALWRIPGSGVATSFNLDGVVHDIVQLSMTPVAPVLSISTPVQATPALATYSSVEPTFVAGQGATLTPQAVILTAAGVGPFIFLHSFYPSPPALSTFTATAPGVTVGSGASVVAPAATASYAAAAPAVAIPGGVTSPPALLTMSAPIPSLSISQSVTVPVGISTFSTVSPVINKETVVGAPVAAWLATDSPPSVAMRLDAPAGIITYTSTAPTGGVFQSAIVSPGQAIFRSVAPGISGVSVGTEFAYTQGSIWQHSMTSGDMEQSQTGRIVQTYERL